MNEERGPSAVRVGLMVAQGISTVAGIALIAIALLYSNHYWPFMDLFWMLVLGCALIVLALNTIVWLRVLGEGQSTHSKLATLVLLVVRSPGATIVLAVIVLLVDAALPG